MSLRGFIITLSLVCSDKHCDIVYLTSDIKNEDRTGLSC